METIGIFADMPTMPTGMAIVCKNLALRLSAYPIRVIYFGRFGQERGFSKESVMQSNLTSFEFVPCEGGVWKPRTVIEAIEHYGVDYIFSEDDFFSASGLVKAARRTKKPLHFLTPIDSLPIHKQAYLVFKECAKVYVPNSAYKKIKNGVYLPHGVDANVFFPQPAQKNEFTFVWAGRDEPRKALGRALLAFMKMYKKADCKLVIHSDWRAETGKRTARFLRYKRDLPVIMTQMEGGSQDILREIYNNSDVFLCTSKAGAFEMGITEAMACGVTPIVTDWTFMNEVVESQIDGFKIPITRTCGDTTTLWNGKRWGIPLNRVWGEVSVNALANAMRFCANNPDVVRELGRKAIEHARTKFDWGVITDKLYKEMIENEG